MSTVMLESKRVIGAKVEATPYTRETLLLANYNFRAFNIQYSPDVEMVLHECARGNWSKLPMIAGKRFGKVSWSTYLTSSGAAATPPDWGFASRACAMRQSVISTTGVSYITHSNYGNVPITIEVQELEEGLAARGLVVVFVGCMGNKKIVIEGVGKPIRLDYEMQGRFEIIEDRTAGAVLKPAGFDTTSPNIVMGATMSAFGETVNLSQFEIDIKNQVMQEDGFIPVSGVVGYHVVDREQPAFKMNPYLQPLASQSFYARWLANTTGALSLVLSGAIPITISAPEIQVTKAYTPGSRNRMISNNIEGVLNGTTAEGELRILQGVGAEPAV